MDSLKQFNKKNCIMPSADYIKNLAEQKARENNIPEKEIETFIKGFKACFNLIKYS